jgi:hypothetical protein
MAGQVGTPGLYIVYYVISLVHKFRVVDVVLVLVRRMACMEVGVDGLAMAVESVLGSGTALADPAEDAGVAQLVVT